MLISGILIGLNGILKVIFAIIPTLFRFDTTVSELPLGLDSIVSDGFSYVHYMTTILPPLQILIEAFLYYLTFKLIMIFLRIIPFVGRLFR